MDFFSLARMRTVLKSYRVLLGGFSWAPMVSFGRSPHQALRLNSFLFSGCNVCNVKLFLSLLPRQQYHKLWSQWKYWHSRVFCNDCLTCAKMIQILRFMNTNCPDTNSSKSYGSFSVNHKVTAAWHKWSGFWILLQHVSVKRYSMKSSKDLTRVVS